MIEITYGQKTKYTLSVALGFFDCLHAGHIALIEEAKLLGNAAVFTFTNDISPYLSKKDGYIYTYSERLIRLEELGVNAVIGARFDEDFKTTSPKDFLDTLFQSAKIEAVVCGTDYTFGAQGQGDVGFLKKYCEEKGVKLSVVEKVFVNGEAASTTRAKDLLKSGEIERLNELLQSDYFVVGTVEKGEQNGSKIGFPTANIELCGGQTRLKEGVYGGYVTLDGKKYKAIINAGARPTFSSYKYKIECHLDGTFPELYGKTVKAEFCFKIRDIQKFANLSELKKQLEKDEKSFERL